jgi:hypothetical protein
MPEFLREAVGDALSAPCLSSDDHVNGDASADEHSCT